MLGDRWGQFDLALLSFHYFSIVIHIYEILVKAFPQYQHSYHLWYGVVRSPRPLIMIRLIREVVRHRIRMPKNRIQQIIK